MIRFILIPLAVMLSCGSTKTGQTAKTDSTIIEEPAVMNQRDSAILPEATDMVLPTCIKNKIDSLMPCCDFFNEVYDDKCNYLGAPDGGFTGKGDGKIPDFFEEAKSEKLVWGTPK